MNTSPIPTINPWLATEERAMLAGGLLLINLFVVLLVAILWLVAFISILKSQFKEPSNKLVWIIVTLFLPLLGPILYFLIGKKQTVNK